VYPVTQDFLDKMKADRRQVLARVEVDYTDPFMDQSLEIEANEQANVSYPQQTADSVDTVTHKYACLDGTWDLTSGEYHLAPSANMLHRYQMGWWGAQLAGVGGAFTAPYPTLTVRHLPRPIRQLKVVGDTAREEWPVDFQIKLYAQDDTLLKTETVIGNDQVSWSKTLEPQVLDVAKQELIITRWSLPGTCAKIIEFFTSIREVYETGDLVSLRLLEEREASQGSLPVGNISSNEISLALSNADKKFDLDNENSPLKNLLKPNRRIQAWLGAEAENAAAENPPTFTRNSVAYLSDGTQVAANQPRFEQGKFGKAVMVEEGTTNLLPTSKTNYPAWEKGKGIASVSFAEETFYGFPVCLITAKNDGLTAYTFVRISSSSIPLTLNIGDKYSATFYVKKVNHRYVGFRVFLSSPYGNSQSVLDLDTGQVYANNPEQQISAAYIGNGWWKVIVINPSLTPTTGYIGICLPIDSAGAENTVCIGQSVLLARTMQLEAKPYATSFVDGTRSSETLTIPTEGVLNPQEGTVEFWWNPLAKTPQTFPSLIATGHWTSPITQDWLAIYWGSSWSNANTVAFAMYNKNGTSNFNMSVTLNPQPYAWYYVAAKWSFVTRIAKLIIYRPDGTYVSTQATINGEPPTFEGWDKFYILQTWNNGDSWANSLIDDLRISNKARSDEEIRAAYEAGGPLQRDESTTYLLTFNGSIYPVEMCWVPLGTFWSLDWDSPDDTLEATVTARDRMELLRKGTYQTSQVQTNKSLYQLAEAVLQDAGLNSSEYIIDTDLQNIIVPYAWFAPDSHREALRRIAEAGLAAAFANREGKIQIESFLITGDEPVLEITEDDYFPPLRAPSRQDQVANEIIVDTQPLRPASSPEEVYRSNEPITIPASTTKTITAFYNKTPVIDAAASLDSPPAGVSIVDGTYYGWGASLKIQNTNATDAQVTLVIQGKPLTVQNKERAIARDETSITENGVLRFEFPANPLVQTLAQAQAIADTLLASVKEPRRDIEVDWRGNPALLLGDRVTVKGKDYHVIRQEIDWQGYLQARLTGRRAI
jgi:hypothetical protein